MSCGTVLWWKIGWPLSLDEGPIPSMLVMSSTLPTGWHGSSHVNAQWFQTCCILPCGHGLCSLSLVGKSQPVSPTYTLSIRKWSCKPLVRKPDHVCPCVWFQIILGTVRVENFEVVLVQGPLDQVIGPTKVGDGDRSCPRSLNSFYHPPLLGQDLSHVPVDLEQAQRQSFPHVQHPTRSWTTHRPPRTDIILLPDMVFTRFLANAVKCTLGRLVGTFPPD